MIPWIDVSAVAFLKNLFQRDTPSIVWAAPEASKQGTAIGNQQEGLNLPGISIFRTNCDEDMERFNQPMVTRGYRFANNPDGRTAQSLLRMPVVVEYTVVSFAQSLSDMNDIEREMWFSTRYKAVVAQIPVVVTGTASVSGTAVTGSGSTWKQLSFPAKNGNPTMIGFGSSVHSDIKQWYQIKSVDSNTGITLVSGPNAPISDGPYVITIPFRFFIDISKPSYQQEIQQQTGKVVYYQLTQTYKVAGDWVHTSNTSLVLSIDMNFYEKVVSGDVITDEQLSGFVITPDAITGSNPADVAFTNYA